MKYCQYCGTQLVDDAKFCSNCGKAISNSSTQETPSYEPDHSSNEQQVLVNKLSTRLKTNGIIWVVVACIQIFIGFFGAWFTLIVGVLNIISAITDMKKSNVILTNPNGVVKAYEPLVNAIIALVYNLVIGGVVGILGSIYYLICVRGFVMENKEQFLAMETDETIKTNNANPQNEKHMNINVILSEQEAMTGTQKEVVVKGMEKPIKINFPKNIKEGSVLVLRNVKITTDNGGTTKRDVYIKINIQKQA